MEEVAARMENFAPKLEVTLIPHTGHVLTNMSERIIPFLAA
jgi:hypothetical protein